jgi:hypothetical protein
MKTLSITTEAIGAMKFATALLTSDDPADHLNQALIKCGYTDNNIEEVDVGDSSVYLGVTSNDQHFVRVTFSYTDTHNGGSSWGTVYFWIADEDSISAEFC